MMPDMVHDIVCPICKQELVIKITEDILEPVRFSVPLRLDDGHEVILDTTHYNETRRGVSRLILVMLTHCPGDNQEGSQPDPWHRLCQFWKTALTSLETYGGESESNPKESTE